MSIFLDESVHTWGLVRVLMSILEVEKCISDRISMCQGVLVKVE